MESRRKVTLQIPLRVLSVFDEVAKRQLGIGRNAFFSLGAILLLAKLAPLTAPKKRALLLKDLDSELQMIFLKAGKAA